MRTENGPLLFRWLLTFFSFFLSPMLLLPFFLADLSLSPRFRISPTITPFRMEGKDQGS